MPLTDADFKFFTDAAGDLSGVDLNAHREKVERIVADAKLRHETWETVRGNVKARQDAIAQALLCSCPCVDCRAALERFTSKIQGT